MQVRSAQGVSCCVCYTLLKPPFSLFLLIWSPFLWPPVPAFSHVPCLWSVSMLSPNNILITLALGSWELKKHVNMFSIFIIYLCNPIWKFSWLWSSSDADNSKPETYRGLCGGQKSPSILLFACEPLLPWGTVLGTSRNPTLTIQLEPGCSGMGVVGEGGQGSVLGRWGRLLHSSAWPTGRGHLAAAFASVLASHLPLLPTQ